MTDHTIIECGQRFSSLASAMAVIPFLPPMQWKVVPAGGYFYLQTRTTRPDAILKILAEHYMHIPFSRIDPPSAVCA